MNQPSPHPWTVADHEGRGHRIVSADGRVVALKYYPKEMQDFVDLRTIEKAPELYKSLRSLVGRAMLILRMQRKDPDQDPEFKAIQKLLEEIERPTGAPKREDPKVL